MQYRQALGQWGENAACAFMEKSGAKLIERNFRWKGGEIDLIFFRDDILIFLEVRTREDDSFMHPLETIDPRKCIKIKQTANYFFYHVWQKDSLCQFDIITIIGNPGNHTLEYFERAFE